MAAHCPSSTDQRDVMPTIYLRDTGHAPYTESTLPGNVLYLNYSSSNVYPNTVPGSSHIRHTSVELPVPTNMLSQESSIGVSDLAVSHIGNSHFNAWRDGRNEMAQPVTRPRATADDVVLSPVSNDPPMGLRTQFSIIGGKELSQQPLSISGIQGQGLSLSLSTQILMPSLQYQPTNSDTSFVCSDQSAMENSFCAREREIYVEPYPNGLSKLACPIKNSKYLKAAQQLLDEFVNVQKALKGKTHKSHASCGTTKVNNGEFESDEMHHNPQESTANSAPHLSPTERQGLQTRMTKLVAMLDEVDRRYKQYYHQIQMVVSSFDVVAGGGAAKCYTALALQTISRHFHCLRDVIDSHICATSKSLGEEDLSPLSVKGVGISRLRYIDQQNRQQKAFQQFGMMQQQAWRPQRGLPETSVSILRAWLFENFLHPYPKDSDKLLLARQTGLTRSQVSNWFINARVRLWKPMIEEMYKDEFGDTEMDSNLENAPKGDREISSSKDGSDSSNLESPSERCHLDASKSGLIHDVQMAAAVTGFQREVNTGETNHMGLRLGEHKPPTGDSNLLQDVLGRHDETRRYMEYQMAEVGKYGSGGVSLTLGLQHCHGGLPVSEGHQSIVAVRGDDMYNPPPLGADMADYDCLSLADRQHRFGSSQLLHDFVA